MYRQGDLLIVRAERPDKQPDAVSGDAVLAYGEATGHAHTLSAPEVAVWRGEDGQVTTVTVRGGDGLLTHPEHETIVLPAETTWRILRQREYAVERRAPVLLQD
ncbi:MAG: hypothetical protein KatS3mg015_2485 [Fimbriimonadales bacterium]|nr:MAG: hypothetical protein KatS3mg015_2485 [Fimbriimonadales bacterium]